MVDAAPLTYSPMALAVIALALTGVAWWVDSFSEKPSLSATITLAAVFIAAGAFFLCFLNTLGPLP
jgi:hypothetical protein